LFEFVIGYWLFVLRSSITSANNDLPNPPSKGGQQQTTNNQQPTTNNNQQPTNNKIKLCAKIADVVKPLEKLEFIAIFTMTMTMTMTITTIITMTMIITMIITMTMTMTITTIINTFLVTIIIIPIPKMVRIKAIAKRRGCAIALFKLAKEFWTKTIALRNGTEAILWPKVC